MQESVKDAGYTPGELLMRRGIVALEKVSDVEELIESGSIDPDELQIRQWQAGMMQQRAGVEDNLKKRQCPFDGNGYAQYREPDAGYKRGDGLDADSIWTEHILRQITKENALRITENKLIR